MLGFIFFFFKKICEVSYIYKRYVNANINTYINANFNTKISARIF